MQAQPLICPGHSRPIPFISYSKQTDDGVFLISACLDKKPMLRNGETGDWVGTFDGHKGAVWSACLNSAATHAATASGDFTAAVWDAITGDRMHEFVHKHLVKTVDFSPDCSKLLTGGKEKKLRVYDTLKYEAEPLVLEGCAEPIKTALWLTDNTILVGCDEPMLRLWDVRADTRKQVQSFDTCAPVGGGGVSGAGAGQGGAGAAHGGMELCTLSSGQRVISLACGSEVQFWDADTFDVKCRHSFDKKAIGYNVSSASLHPGFAPGGEGSVFVAACSDNWVRMYETGTGKELECLKGHHGPVHCIRFSPTGKSYASASEDGTIRIWQNGSGEAPADSVVAEATSS